ncbi:MAG: hypothetical protein U5J78_02245, partial [Parasphingorhabdus sp.]|nr:hypothetical protein [Parasphingorhabdus sp.]
VLLLKKLAEESVQGGPGGWFGNGGISSSERKTFFADMAKKLDGASLAQLSNAYSATDSKGIDGLNRTKELAEAIATHSSPQTKIDFVKAQAANTTDQRTVSDYGMVSRSIDADPQAAALATVIGSMRGDQAAAAFKALSPEQLRSVMNSGIEGTMTTTAMGGTASTSFDWNTKSFDGLMTAAASIRDPDLKARIFDAGVDTMRSVRETDSFLGQPVMIGKDATLSKMADGLTKIIDSDVNGVVSELNRNGTTRDGSDLAGYAAQMLASGKEAKLGEQMAKLQMGNGNNENPIDRLYQTRQVPGTPVSDPTRPNAESLGYFVGAVTKGAEFVTKSVAEQREMTTAVLKSALTIVDKASGFIPNKAIGAPIAITASVAKEWVSMGVRAAIDDPTAGAGRQLSRAALPVDPRTDETAVGQNVTDAFDGARNRVLNDATP